MQSPTSPPAGWYDDTAQPGRMRWWDGSSWTDHYKAALPAEAETPAAPLSTQTATPAQGQRVCPRCGSADALRRIGTMIDEGTSVTTSRARTTTRTTGTYSGSYGSGMDAGSTGGTVYGQSHSTTTGTSLSRTQTARLLLWPDPPRFPFKRWFLRWYLGGTAIVGTLSLPAIDADSVAERIFVSYVTCLVLMWIPALLIVLIQRAVTAPGRARARTAWEQGRRRLVDAYFCTRDGVVVDDGQAFGAIEYKQALFGS
jgi:hypothetical protein